MSMPIQKPGRSKQDYETPDDFIQAFKTRFGPINWDLAASPENAKAEGYFDIPNNSLCQDWYALQGNLWVNPPFADIEPWAKKCAEECLMGAKVFMLVPASIGSNWYREYVEPFSVVLALNPRMSFDAKNAYPKDLILCCYLHGLRGFQTWRWK